MYDQKIMDRCISYALKNPIESRGRNTMSRMAAIITNGRLSYKGLNSYKTHPLAFKFSKDHLKICLHAELMALIKFGDENKMLPWSLDEWDIYVARVLKNDTPALAKPCNVCAGALEYYGIRNVYWTK